MEMLVVWSRWRQRATLGARVRALRVTAGLTQTELAGGRFSKEYVSQVERGKSRPTSETLEWLARRLGTDRQYLEEGLSARRPGRASRRRSRRPTRSLASHRYEAAIDAYRAAGELGEGRTLRRFSCAPSTVRRGRSCGSVGSRRRWRCWSRLLASAPEQVFHGRRSRGRRVPDRRLQVLVVDGGGGGAVARRGVAARRVVGLALRSAAFRHLPVAVALLSARARLGGGPRGHRALARARRQSLGSAAGGRCVLPGLARGRA